MSGSPSGEVRPGAESASLPSDPSMQDILASIRRILSEDERVAEAPVLTTVAAPGVFRLDESMLVHPPAARPPERPPAAPPPAPKAPEPPEPEEDAAAAVEADLVQMILGKVPTAPHTMPDAEPEPPQEAAAADGHAETHARTPPEMPESAPAMADPPMADPSPPAAEPAPVAAPMDQEQPTPPALDETMSDFATTHPPDTVPAELKPVAPGEPLVAPESAAATQSVVAGLMRQLSSERTTPVFREGPTIEDLVREEMRPLLKHWLDTHLPPMVERLVRSELDRLIARAAP